MEKLISEVKPKTNVARYAINDKPIKTQSLIFLDAIDIKADEILGVFLKNPKKN